MYYFNKYFNIFINKICGILLIVVLILLAFFLGLSTASAASTTDWIDNIKPSNLVIGANCTSSGCIPSGVTTTIGYDLVNYEDYTYYYVSSIYTAKGGYGMQWLFTTDVSLKANYLYSVRTYHCSSESIGGFSAINFTTGQSGSSIYNYSNKPTYVQFAGTNPLNTTYFSDSVAGGAFCGYISYYVVPSVDSQYLGIQFTTNNSSTSTQSFVGYDIQPLGLYSTELRSTIDTAIADSNLATAEDIEELNEEIKNQVAEQEKTNEQLKETHDYLTDETPPDSDISSLGNVQGLLPPGPVDSLLNIPFMFLSVIVSSFGNLCVPISGTWVFGQSLTIPCFGDMFYNNVPDSLMIFIDLVPSVFLLILYFKHLYKKVDRAVSMETTSDDEWGVI